MPSQEELTRIVITRRGIEAGFGLDRCDPSTAISLPIFGLSTSPRMAACLSLGKQGDIRRTLIGVDLADFMVALSYQSSHSTQS
jgi:hypothetical protein